MNGDKIKCYIYHCGLIYKREQFITLNHDHLKLIKKIIVGKKKFPDVVIYCWRKIRQGTLINIGINAFNELSDSFDVIDKRDDPISLTNLYTTIEFMDNQELVFNAIIERFSNRPEDTGIIIKLKAGCGKSFISARLITHLAVKTLIIVPSRSILENWTDKVLPNFPEARIGYYYTHGKRDGDIVVMTVKSAIRDHFIFDGITISSIEYFKQFGLVIYDEVHNYVTPTYSEILWRTCFKYRIGISATPEEAKEFEPILYYNIGELFDADALLDTLPRDNTIDWSGEARVYKYIGKEEHTELLYSSIGYISAGDMVKQFEADPHRTILIINSIIELANNNRNIIVFTEHKKHCEEIAHALLKAELNVDTPELPNITILQGGCKKENIIQAKTSPIIIITYGYGKEGISYDHLDTMVFATPRKSKMLQIMPRIMRSGGDRSIPRIFVDIVDVCSHNFKSQYSVRKKTYKLYGFNIIEKKISWEDV